MNLSNYGIAALDHMRDMRGNMVLDALAGCGKSTTQEHIIKSVCHQYGKVKVMAFSKNVAEDVEPRYVSYKDVAVSTCHSAAYSRLFAYAKQNGIKTNWKIFDSKYFSLALEWLEKFHNDRDKTRDFSIASKIDRLASMALLTLTNYANQSNLLQVAEQYEIDADALVLEGTQAVINHGIKLFNNGESISFNEMIALPYYLNAPGHRYNLVVGDEIQDWNAAQIYIALSSMKDGGYFMGAGDPNQAIFGFMGATPNAVSTVVGRTNSTLLPLPINYRCGKLILSEARKIVPNIQDAPEAIQGAVYEASRADLCNILRDTDVVLCRKNAPLIQVCIDLFRCGKGARFEKRGIDKSLARMIKAMSGMGSYSDFFDVFDDYKARELALIKGGEARVLFNDSMDAIEAAYRGLKCLSWEEFQYKFKGLFEGDSGITLSTVHGFKGLESDRIFIVEPDCLPMVWDGQTDEQYEEEMRLKYVAITRAKKELVWVR